MTTPIPQIDINHLLCKRVGDLTVTEWLLVCAHTQANVKSLNSNNCQEIQIKKVPLKKLVQKYGWGQSTIYRWCEEKYIPHHRVGGQYWFDLDEIDRWISEKKIRTKEEVVRDFEKGKKFYSKSKS